MIAKKPAKKCPDSTRISDACRRGHDSSDAELNKTILFAAHTQDEQTQLALTQHSHFLVQGVLAGNPHATPKVIAVLLQDEDDMVRDAAAKRV